MERNCKECKHYQVCRDWYGHEKGMPNYAVDIECRFYSKMTDNNWHDIIKNREDLPKVYGEYDCWARWDEGEEYSNIRLGYGELDSDEQTMENTPKDRIFEGNKGFGEWYGWHEQSVVGVDNVYEVVAWREPDQFDYQPID